MKKRFFISLVVILLFSITYCTKSNNNTSPPEVTTPTPGVTTPTSGVTTPTPGVTTPTSGVTTPTPGVTTPTSGVTTPTSGVTTSTSGVTTPTSGVTTPTSGVTTPTSGVTTSTSFDFSEIADIAKRYGNFDSNTVIINAQGGPSYLLDDNEIMEFIEISDTANVLHVNVHQVQTRFPERFTTKLLTFEEAKSENKASIDMIKKVVDFYKNQGKQVYMHGSSFGAFILQEFIAVHGIDSAEAYIITVGRLDMDDDAWKSFRDGIPVRFMYEADGTYKLTPIDITSSPDFQGIPLVALKNTTIIASGLGFNRYTERLKDIPSLAKITYVYGDRDMATGPLTPKAVQFLKDKGATVILDKNGSHDSASNIGLNLFKSTFGIK